MCFASWNVVAKGDRPVVEDGNSECRLYVSLWYYVDTLTHLAIWFYLHDVLVVKRDHQRETKRRRWRRYGMWSDDRKTERKWKKCSGVLTFYTIDKAQEVCSFPFWLSSQETLVSVYMLTSWRERKQNKQKQNKVGAVWSSTGNQIISLFLSIWFCFMNNSYRMWMQRWFPSNSQTLAYLYEID